VAIKVVQANDDPDLYATTDFTIIPQGCWQVERARYKPLTYYGECVGMKLSLYRKGSFYKRLGLERSWYSKDERDASVRWRCSRSGSYDWKLTYANRSYTPNGTSYVKVYKGSFTIPKCKPKRGRYVSTAKAARDAAEYYYPEFTSQSHCVRGAESGAWTCNVTHNNTYRECVTTLRIRYTSTDEWGRRTNGTSIRRVARRCSYF
jgi:hypothetical protein